MRVGNAAFQQRQLDVYGEVMDALYQCHTHGLPAEEDAWSMRRGMLEFLETCWDRARRGHLGGARTARGSSRTRR